MKKIVTVFILLITYQGFSQTNYVPNVTVSTFVSSSSFDFSGVALDTAGNVYVTSGYRVQKITAGGLITTLAGSGVSGSTDGQGTAASFGDAVSLAVDDSGNIYVADQYNNKIRKITSKGLVSTLAGSTTSGNSDGQGTAARFNQPAGIALDTSGNIYVADAFNNKIRKITPGGLVTTLAGSGIGGGIDGQGTSASFDYPTGLAVDDSGNIYVADQFNNEIRKITSGGLVSTFAGSITYGNTDGQGVAASFYYPAAVALDTSGNIYVADAQNNEIRKITSGGLVSTVAGSTASGKTNGTGSVARFNFPTGLAFDGFGNLYIADLYNDEVRKIRFNATATATVNGINESSISVFPNPAKDLLNINLSEVVNGTLSISDIQGSLVLTQPVNGKQVQLSTASLQDGIYVLNVVSDNVSYHTRVVIAK